MVPCVRQFWKGTPERLSAVGGGVWQSGGGASDWSRTTEGWLQWEVGAAGAHSTRSRLNFVHRVLFYCACVHSIRSRLNVVPRVLFYCACVQYINYLKNMFRKSVSVYAARLTFSLH